MPILSDSVLVESKTARDNHLAQMSHERAAEIMSKVKALYFALWQGAGAATTEQMREFYEVNVDAVEAALRRGRSEFQSDGLKPLKGQQLKEFKQLSASEAESSNAASLTIWTPRAALRLGMVLQNSPIARAVRTSLLDSAVAIPAAVDKVHELELQLAIAQAQQETAQAQREAAASQAETAKTQERLIAASQMLGSINPELPLLILRPDVKVIERPVPVETTVLMDEHNNKVLARYDGVGISFLAQRYGFGKGQRANNACRQWLLSIGVTESQWVEEPTAHVTRKLPRQILAMLDRQFASKQGSRQRLLGE